MELCRCATIGELFKLFRARSLPLRGYPVGMIEVDDTLHVLHCVTRKPVHA